MEYVCPTCKSENIQRLSAIYTGGVSSINTRTNGSAIGFGRGGIAIGFGTARTAGTSQTVASMLAAPPQKKTYFKTLLGLLVASMLAMVILPTVFPASHPAAFTVASNGLALSWIVASIWWVYHVTQFNLRVWPKLKSAWDNAYLCNRCNGTFCLGESH